MENWNNAQQQDLFKRLKENSCLETACRKKITSFQLSLP